MQKLYSKNILWVMLFIVVVLQIYFTIQNLGMGGTIGEKEKEVVNISLENKKLQRELVSKTSLSDLSEKAIEIGFSDQVAHLYIKKDDVFAQALR